MSVATGSTNENHIGALINPYSTILTSKFPHSSARENLVRSSLTKCSATYSINTYIVVIITCTYVLMYVKVYI